MGNGSGRLRCLGLDPGAHLGWAILESVTHRNERPQFVDGGVIRGDYEESIRQLLSRASKENEVDWLVAIESVQGYVHEHKRGAALVACAQQAGTIKGLALGWGLAVNESPATNWRRALCGNGTASDSAIASALAVLVGGMPRRSSVHMRDAIGVAFGASRSGIARSPAFTDTRRPTRESR